MYNSVIGKSQTPLYNCGTWVGDTMAGCIEFYGRDTIPVGMDVSEKLSNDKADKESSHHDKHHLNIRNGVVEAGLSHLGICSLNLEK